MPFSERKVTEAAAFLLELAGGHDFHMRVLKMLYLADREAIARWGFFLSEDRHVSMDFGPVLSETYNLVKGQRRSAFWSNYISPRTNNRIRLLQTCPRDELSRAEENLLTEMYATYGHVDRFELSESTHEFPEWRNPHGSSVPISTREILMAKNVPEAEIREILRDLRVTENVHRAMVDY